MSDEAAASAVPTPVDVPPAAPSAPVESGSAPETTPETSLAQDPPQAQEAPSSSDPPADPVTPVPEPTEPAVASSSDMQTEQSAAPPAQTDPAPEPSAAPPAQTDPAPEPSAAPPAQNDSAPEPAAASSSDMQTEPSGAPPAQTAPAPEPPAQQDGGMEVEDDVVADLPADIGNMVKTAPVEFLEQYNDLTTRHTQTMEALENERKLRADMEERMAALEAKTSATPKSLEQALTDPAPVIPPGNERRVLSALMAAFESVRDAGKEATKEEVIAEAMRQSAAIKAIPAASSEGLPHTQAVQVNHAFDLYNSAWQSVQHAWGKEIEALDKAQRDLKRERDRAASTAQELAKAQAENERLRASSFRKACAAGIKRGVEVENRLREQAPVVEESSSGTDDLLPVEHGVTDVEMEVRPAPPTGPTEVSHKMEDGFTYGRAMVTCKEAVAKALGMIPDSGMVEVVHGAGGDYKKYTFGDEEPKVTREWDGNTIPGVVQKDPSLSAFTGVYPTQGNGKTNVIPLKPQLPPRAGVTYLDLPHTRATTQEFIEESLLTGGYLDYLETGVATLDADMNRRANRPVIYDGDMGGSFF